MGKLSDLYNQAETNSALRSDLEALDKRFKSDPTQNKEAIYSDLINTAKKHGAALSRNDFSQYSELPESIARTDDEGQNFWSDVQSSGLLQAIRNS
jgi:hypothetical protein